MNARDNMSGEMICRFIDDCKNWSSTVEPTAGMKEEMKRRIRERDNLVATRHTANSHQDTPPIATKTGLVHRTWFDQVVRERDEALGLLAKGEGRAKAAIDDALATTLSATQEQLATERQEAGTLRVEWELLRGRLRDWTRAYGRALCPSGGADTFGEGMRAAKNQIRAFLGEPPWAGDGPIRERCPYCGEPLAVPCVMCLARAAEAEAERLLEQLQGARSYACDLQRLIEAHCRGEVVATGTSPHLAEMLNAALAGKE